MDDIDQYTPDENVDMPDEDELSKWPIEPDLRLKALKGAHLELNEDILRFLHTALGMLVEVVTDEDLDKNPSAIVKRLKDKPGWSAISSDSFARVKVVYTRPYPATNDGGELRVGFVITKRGGKMLDIRPWGEY